MRKLAILLVPILLMACSSTPKTDSSQVSQSSNAKKSSDNAASTSAKNANIESLNLAAEISSLQKQSIYFDFDKSSIKPEYRDVIQKQAAFIKTHANDIVTVSGNCDERGSAEYNLALGDRRANTVKKDLEVLGVTAAQIKTVSFGEEKPRLTCHEEKCWKENRRDDFVHKIN